LAIVEESNREL